jgi:arginine/lysine/ornithine decarboxylase
MDHTRLPLWEAVLAHAAASRIRLHLPGHGGGPGLPPELRSLCPEYAYLDLTELPGLDDLHDPAGPILEAEEMAASLWQARRSFYLVNGSTAGVLAMVLATCGPGDTLLLPRNAHLSAYHALVLSGARPVYLTLATDGQGFPLNITAAVVEQALERYPAAKALLVTSPSYFGVCADLAAIAAATRRHGVLLLLDEAHGSHLDFHPEMPAPGRNASMRVQSWHKTLGALTPGAVLHLHSEQSGQARLRAALRWVQTSSPSYPLLLSLDAVRKRMALSGRELFDELYQNVAYLRGKLRAELPLLEREALKEAGFDLDILRITILCGAAGIDGRQASHLLAQRGVNVEQAQKGILLLVAGPGLSRCDAEKVVRAFDRLPCKRVPAVFDCYPEPLVAVLPREAAFAPQESVLLAQAEGRISASLVAVFPPGIPVLAPGEIVTRPVIDYLAAAGDAGMVLRGLEPQGKLRVVYGGCGAG